MRNVGLDESQASRLLGEISNFLRYADDTTLMAESEEEIKGLWMKVMFIWLYLVLVAVCGI